MTEFTKTPEASLTRDFVKLCRDVTDKRPRTVIEHILEHGFITTEELYENYGYDHAPRAARDVRENGIPLITHRVRSEKTGRRMAAYTFDDPTKIKAGRVGGRKAFSKRFKEELIVRYGSRDAFTGEVLDARYLQIDHRIPYEVSGDSAGDLDPRNFMLLDASSNRAKSWSCEHCDNFLKAQDESTCATCFWASPTEYRHVAGDAKRRMEIVWRGDEVAQYERLRKQAGRAGTSVQSLVKAMLGK